MGGHDAFASVDHSTNYECATQLPCPKELRPSQWRCSLSEIYLWKFCSLSPGNKHGLPWTVGAIQKDSPTLCHTFTSTGDASRTDWPRRGYRQNSKARDERLRYTWNLRNDQSSVMFHWGLPSSVMAETFHGRRKLSRELWRETFQIHSICSWSPFNIHGC